MKPKDVPDIEIRQLFDEDVISVENQMSHLRQSTDDHQNSVVLV